MGRHRVASFKHATGTDDQDVLTDLLCDLMHWSDRNQADFEPAVQYARYALRG